MPVVQVTLNLACGGLGHIEGVRFLVEEAGVDPAMVSIY